MQLICLARVLLTGYTSHSTTVPFGSANEAVADNG
jgi:hypothetical protein